MRKKKGAAIRQEKEGEPGNLQSCVGRWEVTRLENVVVAKKVWGLEEGRIFICSGKLDDRGFI